MTEILCVLAPFAFFATAILLPTLPIRLAPMTFEYVSVECWRGWASRTWCTC